MSDNALEPAGRGDKASYNIALGESGVALPADLGGMIEFAKMMCKAGLAIPKHLRDNPGACLSVAMRSRVWRLDPFAVATKTYSVNDILAYEAQLISAVINRNSPIEGRLVPSYTGEGQSRRCVLKPKLKGSEQELPYESPLFKDIKPKNSPLWINDPDQQLYYYSSRAWARRYFPELLMGVYDPEEAREMKDITPRNDNMLHDEETPFVMNKPVIDVSSGEVVVTEDDGDVPIHDEGLEKQIALEEQIAYATAKR